MQCVGEAIFQVCVVTAWLGATSIRISVTFLLPLGIEESSFISKIVTQ